ncbi:hypothetical protein VSO92_13445 [Myroides pelagicus]|uniref:hypothetical protein n=1 Tax=Myroides pelagicus TaxID=270914 RepID=UPI002DBFB2A2|nr:hypothetical protein [Myroides pelagicus]MEC4115104.1 hypothetical protein [Myroides pelagicus]
MPYPIFLKCLTFRGQSRISGAVLGGISTQGESGLRPAVSDKSKELKKAEQENKILRKLLSDKEIELEVQRELLKKKFGTSDPKKIW